MSFQISDPTAELGAQCQLAEKEQGNRTLLSPRAYRDGVTLPPCDVCEDGLSLICWFCCAVTQSPVWTHVIPVSACPIAAWRRRLSRLHL